MILNKIAIFRSSYWIGQSPINLLYSLYSWWLPFWNPKVGHIGRASEALRTILSCCAWKPTPSWRGSTPPPAAPWPAGRRRQRRPQQQRRQRRRPRGRRLWRQWTSRRPRWVGSERWGNDLDNFWYNIQYNNNDDNNNNFSNNDNNSNYYIYIIIIIIVIITITITRILMIIMIIINNKNNSNNNNIYIYIHIILYILVDLFSKTFISFPINYKHLYKW